MSRFLDRATAGWAGKGGAPDWVIVLAKACDASTQAAAAERIGRSAGLVSQVLGGTYPGDMAGVEDAVRGAFMAATIDCPALGTLPTNECQAWRARSKTFVNTNALRVRMYRACHRCPRNPAARDAAERN